jgi:hypothetical protein
MSEEQELPTYAESITIDRAPDDVYAMISDVTRMGEWSPVCTSCWWDEGGSARAGAWFTGRNETPDRTWETHCEVVAADTGREFTFVVGGADNGFARWSYTLAPAGDGTELTESWAILPTLVGYFASNSDDGGAAQVAEREANAHEGIPATLAAIKAAAERG